MEGNRPKPPTVIPLTGKLLKQLQRSLVQQQRLGQSQSQPRQTAQPRQAQTATTQPDKQQERAHLGLSHLAGQQQQNGQGSHTAISLQVLSNAAHPVPQSRTANSRYSYKVKITPHGKSDVIKRHLHKVNSKFESVNGLRVHLMAEFKSMCQQQQHLMLANNFEASNSQKFGW